MLYLLGGASRAGKSTVARRLLQEEGIPYFPLDVLVMGLRGGWPCAGVDPDAPVGRRADHLWPVVREMATNLLDEAATHPSYLLEGDILLPRHAAALSADHPGKVRLCFLGYARADPSAILRRARSAEPDWYNWAPDAEALAFLAEQVEHSRRLELDCESLGVTYVDASESLAAAVDQACRRLLGCP